MQDQRTKREKPQIRPVADPAAEMAAINGIGVRFNADPTAEWNDTDQHFAVEYHDVLPSLERNPGWSGIGWVIVKQPSGEASLQFVVVLDLTKYDGIYEVIRDECRVRWPSITFDGAMVATLNPPTGL